MTKPSGTGRRAAESRAGEAPLPSATASSAARRLSSVSTSGFTGDGDTQVSRALEPTGDCIFLLDALRGALEHDITLRVVSDAHPPNLQVAPPYDRRSARNNLTSPTVR